MAQGILVLIWLGAAEAEVTHRADLETWARARQVVLAKPVSSPAALAQPDHDPVLTLQIEELLEQARVAAGASDETGAEANLATVDGLLREHPELPQAAWLMAERFSVEAHLRERRPEQAERVARLRARAHAIEGQRASTFGSPGSVEAAPGLANGSAQGESVSQKSTPVRFIGLLPGDTVEWDGRVESLPLSAPAGVHQARVLRRGRLVWAKWLEISPPSAEVRVSVPRPRSCSRDDLGEVRIVRDRLLTGAPTCERWAVARPGRAGGIEIAACRRSACEPLRAWPAPSPVAPVNESAPPRWTLYGLVGLGVVTTTAILLWRTGAFDQTNDGRDRVIFSGPAALHF
jgi:hypothetical protein